MEVGRAARALLLHVGDLTVGVDVLIAADDAAAIECGETKESNDTHTTTLAVGSPTGGSTSSGSLWLALTLNRCPVS
jgi:hypothetical protein